MRGFRFRLSLKSDEDEREKTSGSQGKKTDVNYFLILET